ncbi:hypothetical protein K490DRAFT_52754 [Saccharata proteae CBS 121410]|uniref:GPI anchored serine-rich protein n=1 Tax=Saccharata proteae CBS 121410 TaxID=1314787 RepID=A0A9P4LYG5_9PEZI|nr:hypothetical protein K490DRAFT_52754 [Saccharata proteae CBS 121410]
MKGFAVAAIFAGAALAAPAETVYATEEVTITSCGPEVTNCPARSHSATATVPVEASSTPVASAPAMSTPESSVEAATSSPAGSAPVAASSPAVSTAQIYSTSTIYSTQITTSGTQEVTITVPISTTICPVTATETPGASSGVQAGSSAPAVSTPAAGSPSAGMPAGSSAVGTPLVATSPAATPGYPMPASSGAQALSSAPGESSVCVPSTTTSYVYVTPGASIPVGTGSSMPYPSGGVYTAGTPPAGTPAVGTPMSPSGTPVATPGAFTGGSGRVNAMGALAGLGAIAAFFL